MIREASNTSIMGRAVKNGLISVNTINIRDYSANKHMRVDDYPYGGGAGMVIEAEPVFRAVNAARKMAGKNARVVYLTPQARVLDQLKVEELSREEDLIILCGHYEGIDERVLDEVVTDNISIGDYVLTGGELGALVLMDAVSRFVPGVLKNEESSRFESMKDDLLEYPHYTRPEVWHGVKVPEVLLSGDHVKIEEWRHEQALARTKERRPDLYLASLNVHTVYFGAGKVRETAEALNMEISMYGELLDYNRNKLRKNRRRFSEKDLVIFVTGRPDREVFLEVTSNMKADKSRAFILYTDADEAGQETGCQDIIRDSGFISARELFVGESDVSAVSLDIRRKCKETLAF